MATVIDRGRPRPPQPYRSRPGRAAGAGTDLATLWSERPWPGHRPPRPGRGQVRRHLLRRPSQPRPGQPIHPAERPPGILASCQQLLAPDGLLVLTARPYRHRDQLVDLPGQLTQVAEATGLLLYERNAALLVGLREDRLVPRPSFSNCTRSTRPAPTGSRCRSSPTKTSSSSASPKAPRVRDEDAGPLRAGLGQRQRRGDLDEDGLQASLLIAEPAERQEFTEAFDRDIPAGN
jgi:hypothetical protein